MPNNAMLSFQKFEALGKDYLLIFTAHMNRRQRLLLHSCLINGDFSHGSEIISRGLCFGSRYLVLFCFNSKTLGSVMTIH